MNDTDKLIDGIKALISVLLDMGLIDKEELDIIHRMKRDIEELQKMVLSKKLIA